MTGNNTNNKSESDQEDNDDVNDNDWSYGTEKKGNRQVSSILTKQLINVSIIDCLLVTYLTHL